MGLDREIEKFKDNVNESSKIVGCKNIFKTKKTREAEAKRRQELQLIQQQKQNDHLESICNELKDINNKLNSKK